VRFSFCLYFNACVSQDLSNKSRGQLNYDWHNCHYIQNKEQFAEWKQRMGGNLLRSGGVFRRAGEKREVLDVFKSVQVSQKLDTIFLVEYIYNLVIPPPHPREISNYSYLLSPCPYCLWPTPSRLHVDFVYLPFLFRVSLNLLVFPSYSSPILLQGL
jgi:hypothetical protein